MPSEAKTRQQKIDRQLARARWALFLRHTRGIVLHQAHFDLKSPDFRPALVLDCSVDSELAAQ